MKTTEETWCSCLVVTPCPKKKHLWRFSHLNSRTDFMNNFFFIAGTAPILHSIIILSHFALSWSLLTSQGRKEGSGLNTLKLHVQQDMFQVASWSTLFKIRKKKKSLQYNSHKGKTTSKLLKKSSKTNTGGQRDCKDIFFFFFGSETRV